MILLILVNYLWILIKGIHLIYVFQIKEYRLDRIISMYRESGWLHTLYNPKVKRPALTLRNILNVSLLVLFLLISFLYIFESRVAYQFAFYSLIISPFVALFIVSIIVSVTSIPSSIARKLLIMKARIKIKKSDAIFIGVTGSFGKTSVKEYLFHILSTKYKVAKTDKNMNTDVGIAKCINNNLTKDTEIMIIEVGAYKAGEIKSAVGYIPFSAGILTGLGNQHLDLYGSREALMKEESSLLYNVSKTNQIHINSTVPNIESLSNDLPGCQKYGQADDDISAKEIMVTPLGTTAKVEIGNLEFGVKTDLLGKHAILNLLPCIGLAHDLGMSFDAIFTAANSISQISGKLSLQKGAHGTTFIHDGATSNVDGFLSAIDVLKVFPSENKIIITQGIIELGVEKSESYSKIVDQLTGAKIKLYTTDKSFDKKNQSNQIITLNDVSSLIDLVLEKINKDSVVLIEGKFADTDLSRLLKQISSGGEVNTNL